MSACRVLEAQAKKWYPTSFLRLQDTIPFIFVIN